MLEMLERTEARAGDRPQVAPWQFYEIMSHPRWESREDWRREALRRKAGDDRWVEFLEAHTDGAKWRHKRVDRRKRAVRWAWREAYRNAGGGEVKPPRIAECGKAAYKRGSVDVVMTPDPKTGSYVGGGTAIRQRMSCGNVWTCPTCSPKIRAAREREITEGLGNHMRAGGGVLLATLTISHNKGDALADLLAILQGAFSDMANRRAFRDLMADYGVVGRIRALEVTYGQQHGWHPHFHALVLTEKPLDAREVEALRSELLELWDVYTAGRGGHINSHGLDLQVARNAEAAGRYIAKELTDAADAKTGSGSVTPFELLDNDSPRNERLWAEYTGAMRGKRAILWSRGLRDALGLGRAETDAELADEGNAPRDGDILVARVAREVWNRNRNNAALVDAVMLEVMAGDYDRAAELLRCQWEMRADGSGNTWAFFCSRRLE